MRAPVRHQQRVVVEGVAQHASRPVHVACARRADDGAGRLVGRRVGICCAIRGGGFGVVQLLLGGDVREAVHEVDVQLEHFGAVDAVLCGIVGGEWGIGVVPVLREVAGGVVRGDLVVGEFVLEVELDGIVCEGDGAGGAEVRVYAGDAGDEEVRFCQAEVRGEEQGADA